MAPRLGSPTRDTQPCCRFWLKRTQRQHHLTAAFRSFLSKPALEASMLVRTCQSLVTRDPNPPKYPLASVASRFRIFWGRMRAGVSSKRLRPLNLAAATSLAEPSVLHTQRLT